MLGMEVLADEGVTVVDPANSPFLMSEFDAIDDEVLDAVAGITNMIVGNVKTALEEKLGAMGLTTPTASMDRCAARESTKWTVVPFMCFEEKLYVQMCLAPNRDAGLKTARALRVDLYVAPALFGGAILKLK
jgi:hypothetical protein